METIQTGTWPRDLSANFGFSNLAIVQYNLPLKPCSHRHEFITNSFSLAKVSMYLELFCLVLISSGNKRAVEEPLWPCWGHEEWEQLTPTIHLFPHFQHAYLALLSVQVELMLTNGHSPDRLYQCWTGVPRMHSNATMPKSPPGHRCPKEEERMSCGYTVVSSGIFCHRKQPQTSQWKGVPLLNTPLHWWEKCFEICYSSQDSLYFKQ